MKTTITFRPNVARIVLLAVLVLWLLATGLWPAAAAPIALAVEGGATLLGLVPGPVLLAAVLALGWHLNRRFPPARTA
ncbi:hypothetical protein ACFUT3_01425 [Streptomyces cinereoruber]|uniref:hypothetical protein n=1 Tax=Streptomyces cinereoruber TaxID=67260 RepID=UPI0036381B80